MCVLLERVCNEDKETRVLRVEVLMTDVQKVEDNIQHTLACHNDLFKNGDTSARRQEYDHHRRTGVTPTWVFIG